jgi:hypothetical protein
MRHDVFILASVGPCWKLEFKKRAAIFGGLGDGDLSSKRALLPLGASLVI